MIINFNLFEKLSYEPQIGLYIIFRPTPSSLNDVRQRLAKLVYNRIGLIINTDPVSNEIEIYYDVTIDEISDNTVVSQFHKPNNSTIGKWAIWADTDEINNNNHNSFMSGNRNELDAIIKGQQFDL